MSIKSDVMDIRNLFWQKYYGKISLQEMQQEVKKIMDKQGSLKFIGTKSQKAIEGRLNG